MIFVQKIMHLVL